MIKIFRTLLIWIFLQLCMSSHAQEYLYQFRCQANQNLENALIQFSEQHQLKFAYPSFIFDQIYPGEIYIVGENLNEILKNILSPSEIEYQVLEDGKILLRKIQDIKFDGIGNKQKITIHGRILDGSKSEPLEYAALAIPSQQLGTYTDEKGNFSIALNSEALNDHVLVSFLGFESERIRVSEFVDGKTILLKSKSEEIAEITVEGTKPLIIVNQLSASTEIKLDNLLGFGSNAIQSDDILRQLQFMPGIGASDDKNSAIKIRGADESETLVLIDGIPLYKTDHFYGIFSNVNGSYIDDVTLYKNEMPINYSGKSGGLVSMRSDSKFEAISGSVTLDLLNSSFKLGAPLGAGWNILVAGRTTYDNVANAGFFETDTNLEFFNTGNVDFNRPTVLGITPSFNFYDANAKLAFENERISFDANYFRSLDNLSSYFNNTFSSRGPNRSRITNEENFSNTESWENNGASFNMSLKLPNKWTLFSNSYYTEFKDAADLSFSVTNDHPERPLDRNVNNGRNNKIRDIGSTLMAAVDLDGTKLKIGANYVNHRSELSLGEDEQNILRNTKSSYEAGAFGSLTRTIDNKISISAGLRANYYGLTEKIYLSPQLSASYIHNNYLNFKGSYSTNYQYVRELSYSSRFGEEIELFTLSDGKVFPVGQSTNYMIGGTFKKDNWLFDIEMYHIDRDNVLGFTTFLPRLINSNSNNDENRKYRILRGEGSTNGIDMMVSYQSKSYKGLLSYTLSKSENSFKEIFRNTSFPTQDDRRHQLNFTNTYSYRKFDLSANAIYASGRIFTDLSLLEAGEDRRNNNPDRFLKRLPDYIRFDMGIAHNFEFLKKQAKVEFSVLNLLNRENVKYLQFTALIPVNQNNNNSTNETQSVLGTQTNQLDRTYNLSFQLKF